MSGVLRRTSHSAVGGKGQSCKWRRRPAILINAYYVSSCGREYNEPIEHDNGDSCPGCGRGIQKVKR